MSETKWRTPVENPERYKIKVKRIEELTAVIAGLVREGILFVCEEGEGCWVIRCTGGY